MTRRQVPKGGFRLRGRRLRAREVDALERIAAALERLGLSASPEPGGVRGAAGHGPPLSGKTALRRQEGR